MIEGNLSTTNILLGIMAAVSVLQAFLFIGLGVLAFRLYRRIDSLAAKVAALVATVDGLLADVKDVMARVTRQTERVDAAIQHSMHAVEERAGRVFDSVESRISRIAGLVHGVTCAIQDLFGSRRSREKPAT